MPVATPTAHADGGQTAITRRMRGAAVVGVLARHMPSLLALFALPLALAVIEGETKFAIRVLVAGGVVLAIGLLARRLPIDDDLRTHEALAAIALTFLIGALGMTWPLTVYGLTPIDALFESMSGLTSTGFTMAGDIEAWPWSAEIARAWMQWYGGFVILVAVIAVILEPGAAARRLGVLSVESEELVTTMRQRARLVLISYTLLTGLCFLLLYAAYPKLVPAISLTLTAVSTGGFSVYGDSVAGLPLAAGAVVIVFCLATAVPIDHYELIRRRKVGAFLRNSEISLLILAVVLGALGLILLEWLRSSVVSGRTVYDLAFVAASAQSTAGFSTLPVPALSDAQKLILVGMMVIGGAVGSTAGGIKLFRFRVLVALLWTNLLRTAIGPNGLAHIRVGAERIQSREIEGAISILGLFLLTHFLSWLVFLAYGHDPVNALFEIVSAVSTVGLSAGIATPDLADPLKLVLIMNMWLGRLEIIAVVVLLTPRLWLKRN